MISSAFVVWVRQGEYLARHFQYLNLREMHAPQMYNFHNLHSQGHSSVPTFARLQALEIDTLSAMYHVLKVEGRQGTKCHRCVDLKSTVRRFIAADHLFAGDLASVALCGISMMKT